MQHVDLDWTLDLQTKQTNQKRLYKTFMVQAGEIQT